MRMTPARLQDPPVPRWEFASTRTEPPSTSIRFNLLSAKNPIDRLSGDQNGNWAPSVPGSGRAAPESSGRNHIRDCRSVLATKATARPFGEIATDVGVIEGGVSMSRRISAGAGARLSVHAATPAAAAAASATTALNTNA